MGFQAGLEPHVSAGLHGPWHDVFSDPACGTALQDWRQLLSGGLVAVRGLHRATETLRQLTRDER